MIERLRCFPLLNGFRGRPVCDLDALAAAIVAFSEMALELGDRLIEVPIVAAGLARWYRVPAVRGAVIAAVASLLTHPIVWFVFPALVSDTLGYLLAAEGFAWLVEAGIFWLATRRDPVGLLLLSLVANMASFTVGGLLRTLGFW